MTTETLHFVLREGATREEQWTWAELEDMYRSGALTPETRIYMAEEERWITVAESTLVDIVRPGEEEADPERSSVEEEYELAVEKLEDEPNSVEVRLEAAVLAIELGNRELAREHFQTILNRHPYHPRCVQEVRRHYSRGECRSFRYFERPSAPWEDLLELAMYPLARGPLYAVVPIVAGGGLTLLPFGWAVLAVLAYLWCFQVIEYTARGGAQPPQWYRALKDPWRKILRPALLIALVAAKWAVVLVGLSWVMRFVDGAGEKALVAYALNNPIVVVVGVLILLLYFPAAAVAIGSFEKKASLALDPRRIVRIVLRLEQEYLYSVGLLFGVGAISGLVIAMTNGIPVLSNLGIGIATAFGVPIAGLIVGRLLGRNGHLIR